MGHRNSFKYAVVFLMVAKPASSTCQANGAGFRALTFGTARTLGGNDQGLACMAFADLIDKYFELQIIVFLTCPNKTKYSGCPAIRTNGIEATDSPRTS